MEKANIRKEELLIKGEEGIWVEIVQKIIERIKAKEKEERRKRIEESKYNEVYKYIITEKKPEYLRGKKKKRDRNLIAKYRCGNEMKGGQYWKEESERKCRICEESEESMIHVLRECGEIKEEITIEEFLKSDGRLKIMKKIEEA